MDVLGHKVALKKDLLRTVDDVEVAPLRQHKHAHRPLCLGSAKVDSESVVGALLA